MGVVAFAARPVDSLVIAPLKCQLARLACSAIGVWTRGEGPFLALPSVVGIRRLWFRLELARRFCLEAGNDSGVSRSQFAMHASCGCFLLYLVGEGGWGVSYFDGCITNARGWLHPPLCVVLFKARVARTYIVFCLPDVRKKDKERKMIRYTLRRASEAGGGGGGSSVKKIPAYIRVVDTTVGGGGGGFRIFLFLFADVM